MPVIGSGVIMGTLTDQIRFKTLSKEFMVNYCAHSVSSGSAASPLISGQGELLVLGITGIVHDPYRADGDILWQVDSSLQNHHRQPDLRCNFLIVHISHM